MNNIKSIDDGAVDEFCNAVKQTRDAGITHCRINEIDPPLDKFINELQSQFNSDLTPILDEVMKSEGLLPLNDRWYEVNEETAKWILQSVLSIDLAYKSALKSKAVANLFTQDLISFVKRNDSGEGQQYGVRS